MDGARGFRGWLAAITVAGTLTLILLAVEKHIRTPTSNFFKAKQSTDVTAATTKHRGILLSIDPGLAGVAAFPPSDTTPIVRKSAQSTDDSSASRLRRPPEPASSVALRAPVSYDLMAELPLHFSSDKTDYLMDAMDKALESPMQVTSTRTAATPTPSFPMNVDRLAAVPAPARMEGRLPEPKRLMAELDSLQQLVAANQPSDRSTSEGLATADSPASMLVSRTPRLALAPAEAQQVSQWILRTQSIMHRMIMQHGLEHPAAAGDLHELATLAGQGAELGDQITNYHVARNLLSTSYALHRRVTVWQAIQSCLDGTSIALNTPRNPESAKLELAEAIAAVESKLDITGDEAGWRKYLLLDELKHWSQSHQDIWVEGNNLALVALSRLHWLRLNETQKQFLAQAEFEELAAHLLVWGRDPIDYRQLLTELETLEEDPISRVNVSLAGAVQVLRLSREDEQQRLAAALNDHYRNANVRLSISQEMIQRSLPEDQVTNRPVRQNILGADTAGNSEVRTGLYVNLIPDATGWNFGLGVNGDLVSLTRSSKGPAVFHNASTAQIESHRFVRLDPMGYSVSSAPTNVTSQDYVRQMNTDFDSLPIIGDLARVLVREQFNQKRGIARRITQRLIAKETDAELDRRLEEGLSKAQQELTDRLIGPLERLNLNPLVVAMNTTEDRLTIRYRVANEGQMAANTARPRAPTDSLLSMQIHQSAINNTLAQLGLSHRYWTIPELYEHLGNAFQDSHWKLPEDTAEDARNCIVRFADTRPATVELNDGKLRLTLRIAEFQQGDRFHIERFIVSSDYIPVADGMRAELLRDGVVQIQSNHDRLKLRVIFAKIFVSNAQIPLISESWLTDPRSEGLAVSQVDIRDGWLAIAVSKSDSAQAAAVAARAQELLHLK